ncbi:MAG: hypothetical protein IIC89_03345 [Chloroflexi bacterium]|nr:hypothetical protein [Chloroflexota bacterium]
MGLTNRVIIIGAALIWIFVILVVILLAWGAPDNSIDQLSDLANYLADHNDRATKMIITFGGLILILLGLALMIYEVTPSSAGTLNVKLPGGGTARIDCTDGSRTVETTLNRCITRPRTMPKVMPSPAPEIRRAKLYPVCVKIDGRMSKAA